MLSTKSTIFPVFEWSGPFEIRLHKDHLKSDLQKVRILYVSRFQMVGFQIPTVYPNVRVPSLVAV